MGGEQKGKGREGKGRKGEDGREQRGGEGLAYSRRLGSCKT